MSRELFRRSAGENRVNWIKNRETGLGWRRVALITLQVLLAVGLTAGAVWVGPRAARSLRGLLHRQESLAARRLILEGNRLVSKEAIVAALGIGAGDNLLEIDLRELARRLESLPAVKSALVRTQYPSALYVRVEERRPLLVLGGEEKLLVDDEGVAMGTVSPLPEGLPTVHGLAMEGRRVADQRAVAAVSELRIASLAAGFGWPGVFAVLEFASPDGPVAYIECSVPVRLGRGGYREKLARLAQVLPRIGGGQVSVAYIDLRFDSRVVVGTNAEEQPSPGKGQVSTLG
jgi:cell division septal protein FtsQ